MSSRVPASSPAPTVAREPAWGLPRWIGWALLAGVAALVVTGAVASERASTYDDLRAAVAQGDVDEVTVAGGVDGAFRGRQQVEVHWRSGFGLVGHVAPVMEANPLGHRRMSTGGVPVVDTVEEDLRSRGAGVRVERTHGASTGAEVLGWSLPSWTGWVALLLWISVFLLIVSGPPPWRANRWAWFWFLVLASPVGLVAYLVLGGPTGLFPPRLGAPRTRGGWGFLLALVVGAAVSSIGAAVGF